MSRLTKIEKVDSYERKLQRKARPMRQTSIEEILAGAPLMLPANAGTWQDIKRAARKRRREIAT